MTTTIPEDELTEIRLTLREIDTILKSIDKALWSLASNFDKWRQGIEE